MNDRTISIRAATPDDDLTLRWLAALDSAGPLSGRVLLAEQEGRPVAAMAIRTGAVTADPFQPTEHAVRMLLLRRQQLVSGATRVVRSRLSQRRLAPGAAR